MSSPPRPSETLKSYIALLVLQCFAIVKLCVSAYLVLGRPWNDFELVIVIASFVFDVILVMSVLCGTVEDLGIPDFLANLSFFFHFLMLFIMSCFAIFDGNFERLKKQMEHSKSYFFTVMDSNFSCIAFFVVMVMVLFFQWHLIHTVRMLRDPNYKKEYEERKICGININKTVPGELNV